MIKLNLEHLLIPTSFLKIKYDYIWRKAIDWIIKKHSEWQIAFLDVDVNNEVDRINDYVNKNKSKYDNIVVLWIWWSALWTRAILTALKWKYYNELDKESRNGYLKLHILDNIDPIEINQLLQIIDLKKTLFCVISKSGSTLETVSQYQFFRRKYEDLQLDYKNHFVIVAWENSRFKENSLKDGLEVFDIPDAIWGRFSALTSVWLLPLAFIWIDIKWLLRWVSNIKEEFFEKDLTKNKALLTSIILYHCYIELWKNGCRNRMW